MRGICDELNATGNSRGAEDGEGASVAVVDGEIWGIGEPNEGFGDDGMG
jgi:hypothetical protein